MVYQQLVKNLYIETSQPVLYNSISYYVLFNDMYSKY